jgi:hypothetical protein
MEIDGAWLSPTADFMPIGLTSAHSPAGENALHLNFDAFLGCPPIWRGRRKSGQSLMWFEHLDDGR